MDGGRRPPSIAKNAFRMSHKKSPISPGNFISNSLSERWKMPSVCYCAAVVTTLSHTQAFSSFLFLSGPPSLRLNSTILRTTMTTRVRVRTHSVIMQGCLSDIFCWDGRICTHVHTQHALGDARQNRTCDI